MNSNTYSCFEGNDAREIERNIHGGCYAHWINTETALSGWHSACNG